MTWLRILYSKAIPRLTTAQTVGYEDKAGEQLCPIEFLNILSQAGLTPHALHLKINTVVLFFILQQMKTLQPTKFQIEIAFATTIQ
jgi:hypothetical protein